MSRVAEGEAYVLLHVLLAVLECRLAELGGDLGCRVVHELAVGTEDVARGAALLLVGAPRVALLRPGLRHWRRRRSQLGDCRHMLRDGVVQGGRLPVCRGALHRELLWCGRRERPVCPFRAGGGASVGAGMQEELGCRNA